MIFLNSISSREVEVLRLIANELTSKEIADQLFISTNTVNTHKKNLREKLDVKNLAGLVRRGFELGILQLDKSVNHVTPAQWRSQKTENYQGSYIRPMLSQAS